MNIVSIVPTQTEIQFFEDRIYEHNATGINEYNGKLFCKLIYDPDNSIIAGITGWTWAGACEITSLWVKPAYRNKGYGKALLEAAETEAKKENCTTVLLRTYSFQAPQFYKRQGFELAYTVDNFPQGHSQFCFVKRMSRGI